LEDPPMPPHGGRGAKWNATAVRPGASALREAWGAEPEEENLGKL
jgi:hypothetical protein